MILFSKVLRAHISIYQGYFLFHFSSILTTKANNFTFHESTEKSKNKRQLNVFVVIVVKISNLSRTLKFACMYNQWPNHIMYSLVETVKIKTFSIPFDFPHRSKDHTQTKQNKSIFIFLIWYKQRSETERVHTGEKKTFMITLTMLPFDYIASVVFVFCASYKTTVSIL